MSAEVLGGAERAREGLGTIVWSPKLALKVREGHHPHGFRNPIGQN